MVNIVFIVDSTKLLLAIIFDRCDRDLLGAFCDFFEWLIHHGIGQDESNNVQKVMHEATCTADHTINTNSRYLVNRLLL